MTTTTHFGLNIPDFNTAPWHDEMNDNFIILDTLIAKLMGITNFKGIWKNSTAFVIGEKVIDDVDASMYECLVDHTSAASPTTFSADRAANPLNWETVNLANKIGNPPLIRLAVDTEVVTYADITSDVTGSLVFDLDAINGINPTVFKVNIDNVQSFLLDTVRLDLGATTGGIYNLTLYTTNVGTSSLQFGDVDEGDNGFLKYDNSSDEMTIGVATNTLITLTSTGMGIKQPIPAATLHNKGTFRLEDLPTASAGLVTGDVWNDAGALKIIV